MESFLEPALEWRVVYASLVDESAPPAVIVRACDGDTARCIAKDFCVNDAGLALVQERRQGAWFTDIDDGGVVWDKDYTEEAREAIASRFYRGDLVDRIVEASSE